MAIHTITFDFVGTYSSEQPVLGVWYGGTKITTGLAPLSSTSISVDIDTASGFNHNDLRFYFLDNGSEGGRSITISNIRINGVALPVSEFFGDNFSTGPSSITLSQDGYADYDTATEIPEVVDPVIEGTSGNDKIYGTYDNDTINGQNGVDAVYGEGGDDDLYGGAGNDGLVGGDGNDRLFGEADNDKLYGGNGDDRLEGGTGADRLEGNDGVDVLYGGDGNDSLLGGAGDDFLYGEAGDDVLIAGEGTRDELYGGAGNDKLYGNVGNDRLDGGTENDIIAGYDGDDAIFGGDGDDILDGGNGADTITGDAGNDNIYGNVGNDDVRGGLGDDNVYGNGGVDVVYGDAGTDTVHGGDGNDFVYGGTENDLVIGEDGNDRVEGNDGDDVLVGGYGLDTLIGGSGNDIIYGGGADGYDITLMKIADNDLFFNHATQSVYKIITTGADWSTAASFAATQQINGVSGHLLSIESQAENDFIQTELANAGVTSTWLAASDSVTEGTWVWNAGSVNGTTFFSGGATTDGSYNNFGGEHTTGGEDALLMNSSGVWQDANAGSSNTYVIEWNYDDFIADTNANAIFGGLGNDTVFGADGSETIRGEDGNDILYGGGGSDAILGGAGNDVIYGGNGNDTISGDDGTNTLYGGAGNDFLFYRAGDTIDGGANFDTLLLNQYESGAVDISNLSGIGRIALDNYKGAAAANTLTISYSDVSSITGGGNTLYISADQGLDILTVSDLDVGGHYAGTSLVNGVYYEQYSNAGTNLFIETGLVTANQAFVLDPVTVTSIANDVDINLGSYLSKTTGISFQTGTDINTTQVLFEQGGTTRGINIFIENGELHFAIWNFAEENWGYKEVSSAIATNTRYTASMVFDGAFPANGTIEGFLNGVSMGTDTGVGNLYAHSGDISIGSSSGNTIINGSANAGSPFTGTIQKLAQYNDAYSGGQLDAFHDFLAAGWLGGAGNNAPDAVDDSAAVLSGASTLVDVLLNDNDVDGDIITVQSVGSASNGTVVLNGDNTVTYQADAGFTGTDSFTYTIFDGGLTDTATVTITVDPLPGIADPTEITGLDVWYDANDATSYIDGGDLGLEGINDKTANNLDATQGTANAKPNIVTINGDNWMEFDGGDMLEVADSNLINTGGPFNGKTIAISFRTGADVNTRQVIYEQGGGTRGLNFFIDSGDLYINGWNLAETSWGPTNVSGSLTANTEYVATMVYDGVAGTFTGYLNGTILGTVGGLDLLYAHADDTGIGGINGSTYFLTGTGGGNNFTGHIGELAFYDNAISNTDAANLNQYLLDKWVNPPSAPVEDTPVLQQSENTGRVHISGDEKANVINGGDDQEQIHGEGGDDYLYGGNADDELNGGAGRDFLYGEAGNDTLLYGEGSDYLYGGADADTFKAYETAGEDNDMAFIMDFNAADGDRLDISDLLDGFDPNTDDITDFVNVAQGFHTTIQVDRDGAGTQYGWDNVVRLQNNTTLNTDENQLIADGTLLI